MRKKEKMQVIHDYLCQTYGDTPCTLTYENPFELLVSACLAAQCTDARVNIVTEELFAKSYGKGFCRGRYGRRRGDHSLHRLFQKQGQKYCGLRQCADRPV